MSIGEIVILVTLLLSSLIIIIILVLNRRSDENDTRMIRDQFFRISYDNEFSQYKRLNEIDSRYSLRMNDVLRIEAKTIRNVLKEEIIEFINRDVLDLKCLDLNSQKPEVAQNNPDFIIRELSHSLFTPLSQIEAATISLPNSVNDENTNSDIVSSIRSIRTSVAICKAILYAFREQISTSGNVMGWSIPSLKEMIRSAVMVYCERYHKQLDIQIKIYEIETGYSSNFLTAILMPLLENAVEASPPHSIIFVKSKLRENFYILEITNDFSDQVVPENLYQSGISTKDGHEGIGLTVVQHLLAIRKNATLTHSIKGQKITFRISLPMRGENEN
jgi:signal transduction histidine kinase